MFRDQGRLFQTHPSNCEELLPPNVLDSVGLGLGIKSLESIISEEFRGLLKLLDTRLVHPSESK